MEFGEGIKEIESEWCEIKSDYGDYSDHSSDSCRNISSSNNYDTAAPLEVAAIKAIDRNSNTTCSKSSNN